MTSFSELALYFAFAAGCYAILALGFGVFGRKARLVESGKNAVMGMCALAAVASIGLWRALLASDFSLEYVAAHSNRTLSPFYKFSSFWSGMEGSLLFWLLLVSIYAFIFVFRNRKNPDPIYPTTSMVVAIVQTFFAGLVCFAANPFKATDPQILSQIVDGQGLNTLLQDPAMVIHPPCLYAGYVGWAIPFGFGIAVLMLGRRGSYWIEQARLWILVPWVFLTAGVSLGGWWAYKELGWGGWWAWDPVENASIFPWFAASAFLHSIMIQQRRDMLKVWNMVLLLLTFFLTIFGTFLTRGGLKNLVSVHSFTGARFAYAFSAFMVFILIGGVALLIARLPILRSRNRFDSVASREVAFLLNNLVLLCICIATIAGTVWPVISVAVVGREITVGERFFNQVNVPLGLVLLLLMGIGPVIPWRKASPAALRRIFLVPVIVGVAATAAVLAAGVPLENWKTLLLVFGATFTLLITLNEFRKGAKVRSEQMGIGFLPALASTVFLNRRRYGGYIVHIGVVIAFVGFLGSHKEGYQQTRPQFMKEGDEMSLSSGLMGTYTVRYVGTEIEYDRNDRGEIHSVSSAARLLLTKNGMPVNYLLPAKSRYVVAGKPSADESTEVAYHPTLMGDVYAVAAWGGDDGVSVTLFLNPLISLVWWGAIIAVLGGIFCLTDRRRVISSPPVARPSRDTSELAGARA
ncbi:MAG: heme lyase CcmF/NrfE family subunit [Planctomycetes bacterium]|nr:heme lyase CcmF/NrfE family subunit [Planctomycetota bacterium]MBI3847742.1 heme lyase CcmF/NrfE family subunit [Planctomycetota bacterium]